jgi:hypothetical protein
MNTEIEDAKKLVEQILRQRWEGSAVCYVSTDQLYDLLKILTEIDNTITNLWEMSLGDDV